MEIADLKLLVDVAKLGSFAEAARQRNIDPSQVSRSISGLEKELGIRLFNRSTRSLSISEAGERYLRRVEPLIEELETAALLAEEEHQQPSGKLRITASNAFGQTCLMPHLSDFYSEYPDIELELLFTDSNLDLLEQNIDVACRLSPSFDSSHIGYRLFNTQYRVCASPGYLETHQPIGQPKDLSEHLVVTMNIANYRKSWHFLNSLGETLDIQIQSRLSVSNALSLKDLLVRSKGPALIADWLVREELENGRLVDLFPNWKVTATDFSTAAWLLYPSRKYLPMKTRVMVDFLKTRLSQSKSV